MCSIWRTSPRWWRVVVGVTLVWGLLRLGMQVYLFLSPMSDQIGVDLKEGYLVAGQRFLDGANLYPTAVTTMEGLYFYAPSFAVLLAPLSRLPEGVVVFLWGLMCLASYLGLFLTWQRIFGFLGLERAQQLLWFSLPLWVVFSPFWDDATYLNIYTLMALLGSLLIEAILRERLLPAALYLMLIWATKPHWAFALALPLLLGRVGFFKKLLLGSLMAYGGLVLASMAASSPRYILDQYQAYFQFLTHLTQMHPWRTATANGFLGYNHSLVQLAVFLGGEGARRVGQGIKYLLLLPAGVLLVAYAWRQWRGVAKAGGEERLILTFTLYLLAFLWLDLLWELSLSIAMYPFLRSLNLKRGEHWLVATVFFPYALLDIWRMVVYAAGSPLIDEAYLLWDFSAHLPVILFVGLAFYFLLMRRLWSLTWANAGS